MKICDECQSFDGSHSHNAPYHVDYCTCDGSDQSRRPVVDEEVMLSMRLEDLSQQSVELGETGAYSGKEVLPWRAIKRRLQNLWQD